MKKFVKPLVIAASVAAVAGIGAVSFAKWTGTSEVTSTGGPTANNTEVTLVGFAQGTADAWTDKLVPYDQAESTITTGEKIVSITLPAVTAVANQTITVKAEWSDSYTVTSGKTNELYVQIGDNAATDAAAIVSSGTKLDSTGVIVKTLDSAVSAKAFVLSFALKSDDTAAMGKTINITVTLSDAT